MSDQTLELTFADRIDADAAEIGDFLFLFRGAYAAGTLALREAQLFEDHSRAARDVRSFLTSLSLRKLNDLFTSDLGRHRLIANRISHESPLVIVLTGTFVALAAAAILAGGRIKLGPFEARVSSLGSGIKKLREALSPASEITIGYSVTVKRIKLSPAEFGELMRQDPTSRGRGGFQSFLAGLQPRVNRNTREIDLSPREVDVIMRYARHPERGGWQARIKRMFGRHFRLS